MIIYQDYTYLSVVEDETVEDQKPEAFADAVVSDGNVDPGKTICLNSDDIGKIEAQNKHPEWQKRMIKHSDIWVVRHLTENPNLVPELQVELAKHPDYWVVRCLAGNPNLIPEVQVELAKHPDVGVVCWLSENLNLTPEVRTMVDKKLKKK